MAAIDVTELNQRVQIMEDRQSIGEDFLSTVARNQTEIFEDLIQIVKNQHNTLVMQQAQIERLSAYVEKMQEDD